MTLPPVFDAPPAWLSDSSDGVVISSRVRLARNVVGHPFPSRTVLAERSRLFKNLTESASLLPVFSNARCYNLAELEPMQRQLLLERRAASQKLLSIDGDRGTLTNTDASFSLIVNEEDHLRLQAVAPGACALTLWEKLDAVDRVFGERVQYAFDPTRGFLTSCPTNCGTGLRVSFLMHLPGLVLTRTIDQVLSGAGHLGLSARGFFGEGSDAVGHFFQIANRAGCGIAEDDLLHETALFASRIAEYERNARARLLAEAVPEIGEKVWRSYGILRYARMLSLHEFLSLSSALRLGAVLGMLPAETSRLLDRLTLAAMPAHLDLAVGRTVEAGERDLVRAGLVREHIAALG